MTDTELQKAIVNSGFEPITIPARKRATDGGE